MQARRTLTVQIRIMSMIYGSMHKIVTEQLQFHKYFRLEPRQLTEKHKGNALKMRLLFYSVIKKNEIVF